MLKANHYTVLFREWDLQVQLGRDPKVVLGDRYKEDNHYEFKD